MIYLLLALIAILLLIQKNTKTPVKIDSCKTGHKWTYKNEGTDEEYMVCSICNRRPGTIDDGAIL
jgi:hypothetical protein